MQRLADTWRSPIGSCAIMVVITLFRDNPKDFPNDKKRQKWATWYLEHCRFQYQKADADDPKVYNLLLYHLPTNDCV